MMRAFEAALVQMCATGDPEASVARAFALTEDALARGAELVVLPENFGGVGAPEARASWAFDPAAPERSPAIAPFVARSRESDAVIVLGGHPQRVDDTHTANVLLVLRRGRIVARYRKLHLFDADLPDGTQLRESSHTVAGTEARAVACDLGTIGLSICYDLRFPELYRALSAAGAELVVVPSAFTLLTGLAHWEPLLRARAIENQMFVLAAAQHGMHGPGRYSYGHSMIVDPWGSVIAQAGEGDAIVHARLDPTALALARARLPALTHRKLVADHPVDIVPC
jgi:predicted amidohydrolase